MGSGAAARGPTVDIAQAWAYAWGRCTVGVITRMARDIGAMRVLYIVIGVLCAGAEFAVLPDVVGSE